MFGRQSYKVGDRHHFWGGLNVEAVGGGPGPGARRSSSARPRSGIEVRYGAAGAQAAPGRDAGA